MIDTGWRSIPFCVEALKAVRPKRVLDVGGSEHWAALADSVLREDSGRVHVEALVSGNIRPRLRGLYDHVRAGDIAGLLRDIQGRWDTVIIGSALLEYPTRVGKELVQHAANIGRYVIVDIPLGAGAARGVWSLNDFKGLPVVRRRLYRDDDKRLCVCAIISRGDPCGIGGGLPGHEGYDDAPDTGPDGLERVLDRIAQQTHELEFIKGYSTYRLGKRLVRHPAWNALRWARNRNRSVVTVEATGEKNQAAQGSEVHILHAAVEPRARSIPWDFAEHRGEWRVEPARAGADPFLASGRGRVRLPLGLNPEVRLRKHPHGGIARVRLGGREHEIDLFAHEPHVVSVYPALDNPVAEPSESERFSLRGDPQLRADLPGRGGFTEQQQEFITKMRDTGSEICAVHTPRWLGITASTRELFDHCYPVPNSRDQEPYQYDDAAIKHHARVLLEAGARHVVFSGGDRVHFRLMEVLHRLDPELRLDMLWHGSYVQFSEDYNWHMLKLWIDAAKAGVVHSVGTVKAGMERFIESCGVRSKLVMNLIPGDVQSPPEIEDDRVHLGMWISGVSYRKIPHAMLSAVAMTPGACLHAAGLEPRAREVIEYFGIETERVEDAPLPHDELLAAMRRTHLTLYVTFSECCPMVPLESLQLGVPCLTGPNSHLFEEDAYLHERLVVPYPDRADVIADHITRAVEERDEIVRRYAAYIPGYNGRARESVRGFLGES